MRRKSHPGLAVRNTSSWKERIQRCLTLLVTPPSPPDLDPATGPRAISFRVTRVQTRKKGNEPPNTAPFPRISSRKPPCGHRTRGHKTCSDTSRPATARTARYTRAIADGSGGGRQPHLAPPINTTREAASSHTHETHIRRTRHNAPTSRAFAPRRAPDLCPGYATHSTGRPEEPQSP